MEGKDINQRKKIFNRHRRVSEIKFFAIGVSILAWTLMAGILSAWFFSIPSMGLNDWTNVAAIIGGICGPLFAFSAALLFLSSIELQQIELESLRKENQVSRFESFFMQQSTNLRNTRFRMAQIISIGSNVGPNGFFKTAFENLKGDFLNRLKDHPALKSIQDLNDPRVLEDPQVQQLIIKVLLVAINNSLVNGYRFNLLNEYLFELLSLLRLINHFDGEKGQYFAQVSSSMSSYELSYIWLIMGTFDKRENEVLSELIMESNLFKSRKKYQVINWIDSYLDSKSLKFLSPLN